MATDSGIINGHGFVSDGGGAGASHWTDVGSIRGPKGIQGTRGIQGIQGISMNLMGHATEADIHKKTGHLGEMWIAIGGTSDGHAFAWTGSKTKWVNKGQFKGDIGPQGLQGVKGIQGVAGPVGAKGNTGPTGAQGQQGPIGHDGSIGASGNTGPRGLQGTGLEIKSIKDNEAAINAIVNPEIGEIHLAKDTGNMWIFDNPTPPHAAAGADWHEIGHIRGPVGAAGAKGATGAIGPKGDAGAKGAKGDTGPAGVHGTNGTNGAKGLKGDHGTGTILQGSDTALKIMAKTRVEGHLWISTTTGTDGKGAAFAKGDGLSVIGGKWVSIGAVRGHDGHVGCSRCCRSKRVIKVMTELSELVVLRETKVQLDHKALKVKRVTRVFRVSMEQQDIMELQVPQVLKVQLVKQELV